MPTYEQLYHLNVSALDDAVTSWEETVNRLRRLCDSFDERVNTPFRRAGWTEPAFIVGNARQRISRTEQEYNDALAVATSVHGVLESTRKELVAARKALHEIAEHEAPSRGYRVSPTGKVARHETAQADVREEHQGDQIALASMIGDALTRASEADQVACWALRRNLGENRGQFHSSKGLVGSLDEADKAGRALEKRNEKHLEELRKKNFWDHMRTGADIIAGLQLRGPVGVGLDQLAEHTGFNNTTGYNLSASVGADGSSYGVEGAVVVTKTPDGGSQLNLVGSLGKSVEVDAKDGMTGGFSYGLKAGEIKSNADDREQLEGFSWNKEGSAAGGRGVWAEHQTAIGTENSKGEGVEAYNRGAVLKGAGLGVSSGFSFAKGVTLLKWGGD